MLLTARAKINWTLDILGRRADGYHQMDMLMSGVELADRLWIEPADDLTLQDALGFEDNLVLKAAHLLRQTTGCTQGARMRLEKHVPVGAGMGGGSADAAAALMGLNRLWSLDIPADELNRLALALGADVPFVMAGGTARVGGIGEQIQPLPSLPRVALVVVQPCSALSTREVFQAFDALPDVRHPQTDEAIQALYARDFARFGSCAGNVLQQASEVKRPQIVEAIAALDASGAQFAAMTGSGSAVFGAFADEQAAARAYQALHRRWKRTWLTSTSEQGVSFEA